MELRDLEEKEHYVHVQLIDFHQKIELLEKDLQQYRKFKEELEYDIQVQQQIFIEYKEKLVNSKSTTSYASKIEEFFNVKKVGLFINLKEVVESIENELRIAKQGVAKMDQQMRDIHKKQYQIKEYT